MDAELQMIEGKPVLRFERRLRHSPEKVWRVVTEPAEMKHWFPAEVTIDGRTLRFTFPDAAPVDADGGEGELLESDPPKVFAFRWANDVLRFEILPQADGCLLVFTAVVSSKLSAGRDVPGWITCLDALVAHADGTEFEPPTEWLSRIEYYIAKFGLDEGTDNPDGIHFARDLVWTPLDDVWALLTEGATGTVPTRAAHPGITPGRLTRSEASHLLEYEWLQDGIPQGVVRWEFQHEHLQGTTVTLFQENAHGPEALAAWHVHMELFFAASQGDIRCPWPTAREEELAKRYADQ
ncbi:SRPBCC domain-containing protein [Amycolatopsis sp. TNS106]|uniref:SRPBCC domain-containing protein n=1 Tax=Amycolatopsis sp. TNS106 TaxID=2861750 RepID=UPI002103F823|nr:SRPBCC domain-containing protein [Amycolatopsis sp. TNS106]